MPEPMQITIQHGLECDVYTCVPLGVEDAWAFPVGQDGYPPERWYSAQQHSATHTGIDLNLDGPYGDSERMLGLAVFNVSDGYVSYITDDWGDVPMMVVHTTHFGKPLYIRYAHIVASFMKGEQVKAGQRLGGFANWTHYDGGDHLHFDMCLDPIEGDWLNSKRWVDPVDVLKQHLDPARVDAMIARK
jgi:murein DD-endopeptidase MepM/ murein hydrolase activator NlpD